MVTGSITVAALCTWVAGCFFEPHEHIHLRKKGGGHAYVTAVRVNATVALLSLKSITQTQPWNSQEGWTQRFTAGQVMAQCFGNHNWQRLLLQGKSFLGQISNIQRDVRDYELLIWARMCISPLPKVILNLSKVKIESAFGRGERMRMTSYAALETGERERWLEWAEVSCWIQEHHLLSRSWPWQEKGAHHSCEAACQ